MTVGWKTVVVGAAVVVATTVLAACDSGSPSALRSATTMNLRQDMTKVAADAAAGNTAGARSALAALKDAAAHAHDNRVIDDATYGGFLAAASRVQSDLSTPAATAPAPVTSTQVAPVAVTPRVPAPPDPRGDSNPGKGKGKGHDGD